MWRLALKGFCRNPIRAGLISAAMAIPVAALIILSSFGSAYENSIQSELGRMGMQMMIVPIGCPYDAAARVLKGQVLDNTLPISALERVRADRAVAVAAPMLIAAASRPEEKRVDLWVGLDEAGRALRPWWKAKAGREWFTLTNGVILGAEAATIEMRAPGDKFYSGQGGWSLNVEGVLERSGMSDDNLFFVPLPVAQSMFGLSNRLTAIGVRLRDPGTLRETAARFQEIPGAQVTTFAEVTGVFLNVVGSIQIVLQSIMALAIAICALSLFNTMLAGVLERSGELAVMRAVGASALQVFTVITLESLLFAFAAAIGGGVFALLAGGWAESFIRPLLPLAPAAELWQQSLRAFTRPFVICALVGLLAGAFPAWRASRIQPAIGIKSV